MLQGEKKAMLTKENSKDGKEQMRDVAEELSLAADPFKQD